MGERTQDKFLWCEWCGHGFYSSRYDAKFCCAQHRLASHRAGKRFISSETNMKEHIAAYLRQFRNDEMYQYAIDNLVKFLQANSIRTL